MNTYRLNPEDMVLLVIDIQDRLAAAMDSAVADSVTAATSILLDLCRVYSMPVIVTEQYPRGLGPTVQPLRDRLEGVQVYEKLYFDAMAEDHIRAAVDATGRKTVVVAGMEAHICVLQTILSLKERGYRPVMASDAVCSRSRENWRAACTIAAQAGVLVYPVETIAFMVLGRAGTPQFKEISPLFR